MRGALEQLEHVRVWVAAVILAPVWHWVQAHWAGFWFSRLLRRQRPPREA